MALTVSGPSRTQDHISEAAFIKLYPDGRQELLHLKLTPPATPGSPTSSSSGAPPPFLVYLTIWARVWGWF